MSVSLGADRSATVTEDAGNGAVKYFGASLLSVIRVFGRFSLRVFATVPTLVIITLCQGFGPPLLSSLLWDRIAHALFVTSYLIIVSLCVMLVITIAYDKYTGK